MMSKIKKFWTGVKHTFVIIIMACLFFGGITLSFGAVTYWFEYDVFPVWDFLIGTGLFLLLGGILGVVGIEENNQQNDETRHSRK